jgi:hypothetical protein
MSKIPFKNEKAIRSLCVGDTFSGDSGMGGNFTYTVERCKTDGLILSSSSDAPWEKNAFHDWSEIKDNFFVSASTPMHNVNKAQFTAAQKAGYDRSEDFAKAIGCTDMEVARGLSIPTDVYTIKNTEGKEVYFDNKHDAMFIARVSGVLPPEKTSISMEQYLTSPVSSSIADHLINALASKVLTRYPDLSVEQQRRSLKSQLELYIKIPNGSIIDINENDPDDCSPRELADTFSRVVDKVALSSVMRAQEVLNDPDSYSHDHGSMKKEHHNTEITLLINGEPKPFIHQEVHNQLFVLYNDELGMSSPDDTQHLKTIIEPVLVQLNNNRKQQNDDTLENKNTRSR